MSGDRAAWLKISDPDGPLYDRVKAIYHYNLFNPDPHIPDRLPAPFNVQSFSHLDTGEKLYVDYDKEATRMRSFCTELYDLVDESPLHIAGLDRRFSDMIECNFMPTRRKESPFGDEPGLDLKAEIPKRTLQILKRLPRTSPELPGMPGTLSPAYFSRSTTQCHSRALAWDDLKVASYLSTNVIRVAMCIVIHPWGATGKIAEFANLIAQILDIATKMSPSSETSAASYGWYVVRSFLWTSWQRTVMIYFSDLLDNDLQIGVTDGMSNRKVLIQSFSPLLGSSLQEMSKRYAAVGKSHYMCAWAFQLLRSNPLCICMDFRKAHWLYCGKFDRYPARCTPNRTLSCKGDHPHSCRRFVGMVIENQSAHDGGCKGCEQLIWDENSFRLTIGAKAVSLDDVVGNKLKYWTASKQTLAISHVWSHGQGGRPETGMNRCLHERYKFIARSMGCDSYWMDTPCIPTDHVLRREAILNINNIFAQSKATLICDRDLMDIEVNDEIPVELCELILVTLITCDWNVRAWTFLEAFRGRQSIQLLCKNNKTLSLRAIVEIVHHEGSLDIGALLLTVPHLLPRRVYPESVHQNRPSFRGFLNVANSAAYLSRRPASRPGDDIVIWSLLLEEKVYENAIDFWRSRQGGNIATSFLVSTAPRLNIWRLGWAPATPRIFLDSPTATEPRSMGVDDITSARGLMTADGLEAEWLFYGLRRVEMNLSKLPLCRRAFPYRNLQKIGKNFLQRYHWGALLRALRKDDPKGDLPATNQEDVARVLVVVCGTNELPCEDTAWEWKGVHEWDLRESLPEFAYKKNILLV